MYIYFKNSHRLEEVFAGHISYETLVFNYTKESHNSLKE